MLVKLYDPIASYKWDEIVLATSDISLAPATSDISRKRVFFQPVLTVNSSILQLYQ